MQASRGLGHGPPDPLGGDLALRAEALRELADAELLEHPRDLAQLGGQGRALPADLREVPWMLEELRVSQFAQGLGTKGAVSAKRIRRALEAAA